MRDPGAARKARRPGSMGGALSLFAEVSDIAYAGTACPLLPAATRASETCAHRLADRSVAMKTLKLLCTTALLVAIPTASMAYRVGAPDTYSDLLWRVSSSVSGLSGCTELQVDATGDLFNSSKLSIYGALNCPFQSSGSYGVVGSAYFGSDGSFNMTLIIGSSTTLECIRMSSSLNGTCFYYTSSGARLGSAFLTYF